jgi:hypothetical protein
VEIESPQGMAAETSSAATILLSSHFGYPLSTTHVVTGSILGSGVGKPGAQVRWGVAGRMATAWLLTLPAGPSAEQEADEAWRKDQPGSPNFWPLYSAAYATLGGASTAIGARSTTRSQANVIGAGVILGTNDTGPLTGEQSSCGASGKVRLTCASLLSAPAAWRYASQKSSVVCGSGFVMMVSSAVMVHVTDPH